MVRINYKTLLFCQIAEIDWACIMMYICCLLGFWGFFILVENLKFPLEYANLISFDISSWLSEYSMQC